MVGGWKIPEEKRDLFKKPLGKFIEPSELKKDNANMVITVGDVVSLTVWELGIVPHLSLYDGYTERREMTDFSAFVENECKEKKVISNPAGTISCELDDAIRNVLKSEKPAIINVGGEEDLALMPCILHSPDGTRIVYGWPGKGMMLVTTDESIRKEIQQLWKEMEAIE